jgi:hypothetical protein
VRLVILTPFIPLSMIGISSYYEGEGKKRGALAPLRHPVGYPDGKGFV